MAELKHCPFCGKTPKIKFATWVGYSVMCVNEDCGVMVTTASMPTKELAIKAWNRRDGNSQCVED